MRTAIVYDFFPHYRAPIMRELLRSTEHEYFLVADEQPIDPSIKIWKAEDESRFVRAPYRKIFSKAYLQKKVIGLALRRDVDAIIYMAYPYFLTTWLSALVARLSGKKVLFWTHGWIRFEHGPKAWLRRTFYKLAHTLLLYGHSAKMEGLNQGFSHTDLHVIYNSLDLDLQKRIREEVTPSELTEVKAELFKRPDLPIAICSARLTESCRLDLLLDAQLKLRSEGHEFNVLLIGDGPARTSLEAQSRRLGLPVCFYGACYDEAALARMIMASHVTVSPGKVGLTAMHSLAYGTPVITHDDYQAQGPEWEAVISNRTGDFFHRGDIADLVGVIRKWTVGSKVDPLIRMECQRIVEKFYNPSFQRQAIDRAVSGAPADDLFWMKECQSVAA